MKRLAAPGTILRFGFAALLLMGAGLLLVWPVSAAQIGSRSITLGSSLPDAVTDYNVQFIVPPGGGALGSIRVEFCANTALFSEACIPPAGFDISQASVQSQDPDISLMIQTHETNSNNLVMTRMPNSGYTGPVGFVVTNVHNPTAKQTFFARITTYPAFDGTGVVTDRGALAMTTNNDISVSTEVPPYLTFCVGVRIPQPNCTDVEGDYVNVGQLTPGRAAYGVTQMAAATNAANGYTVRVSGQTMASGNDIITPLDQPTESAPGLNQFGLNLRANSGPATGREPFGPGVGSYVARYGQPNRFAFSSGDVVAGAPGLDDYRVYTVSYLVNVSRSQPPGVYTGTYTYIALGDF